MKIPYYQIDAFTDTVFAGNPAGVCLLEEWPEDTVLQSIAAENNLSETAFLVKSGKTYDLKWFTPKMEVDLCGHATLASAFVILEYVDPSSDRVSFESNSGLLTVTRADDLFTMDFPSRPAKACRTPGMLANALGNDPVEIRLSVRDYLAIFDTEEQVRRLQPDMQGLCTLDCLGIIITAPGMKCDFVSRFFAPKAGIPEDPVTGSAHCTLIPYWAERLKKTKLHAFQVSQRGGELFCEHHGDRVRIAGKAVMFLQGSIVI
jgi:PhzF family phenazine biosynthesis protein